MAEAIIATQLANPDKYTFLVPQDAHWSRIRHLKTNVGTSLNFLICWARPTNT